MRNDEHPQRLLSVPATGRYLGVPTATVRSWIRRGVVPSIRLGGRRLIDIEALQGAIASCSAVTTKGGSR